MGARTASSSSTTRIRAPSSPAPFVTGTAGAAATGTGVGMGAAGIRTTKRVSPGRGSNLEIAAGLPNDLPRDIEPEPCAARPLGGGKWMEEPLAHGRRHARAGVAHRREHVAGLAPRLDPEQPPPGGAVHRVGGVAQQVDEDLLQAAGGTVAGGIAASSRSSSVISSTPNRYETRSVALRSASFRSMLVLGGASERTKRSRPESSLPARRA